jgi:hypothetical protein
VGGRLRIFSFVDSASHDSPSNSAGAPPVSGRPLAAWEHRDGIP